MVKCPSCFNNIDPELEEFAGWLIEHKNTERMDSDDAGDVVKEYNRFQCGV